jgi:hypothetical protein
MQGQRSLVGIGPRSEPMGEAPASRRYSRKTAIATSKTIMKITDHRVNRANPFQKFCRSARKASGVSARIGGWAAWL